MKRTRFTETQIVAVLKEVDSGVPVKDVCRKHGISDQTYYNWRSKYGGMEPSDTLEKLGRLIKAKIREKRKSNLFSKSKGLYFEITPPYKGFPNVVLPWTYGPTPIGCAKHN
jgi:transposase-like protein